MLGCCGADVEAPLLECTRALETCATRCAAHGCTIRSLACEGAKLIKKKNLQPGPTAFSHNLWIGWHRQVALTKQQRASLKVRAKMLIRACDIAHEFSAIERHKLNGGQATCT
jgi:hypothetical protein